MSRPLGWIELPAELWDCVARLVLDDHLPSALRIVQTCAALRDHLQLVRHLAGARRLQWNSSGTKGFVISNERRTITRVGCHPEPRDDWALGPLLPVGSWSCLVTVDHAGDGPRSDGPRWLPVMAINLGVCHADTQTGVKTGWFLNLVRGGMRCLQMSDGKIKRKGVQGPFGSAILHHPDRLGRPIGVQLDELYPGGFAGGIEVEMIFDGNAGTLAFRIDDGPLLPALSGFPPGAALRVCARGPHEHARMTLSRFLRPVESVTVD